jgi:putative oxidoreductase
VTLPADVAFTVLAIGRLLLGGLYVSGGVHHFFALGPLTEAMRARGVPMPGLALIAGSLFQIVAGVFLILGWYVTWSALGLVVFTIAASVIFLNFWSLEGDARTNAFRGWQTNLAIIGGLLVAAAIAG